MIEKLRNKAIYDDFLNKTILADEQINILNRLLKKQTIVKIALELGISQRTVNYEIRKIKNLYEEYKKIEIAKLLLLIN